MKIILFAVLAIACLSSCNNSSKGKTFCDTTCVTDSFRFRGDAEFQQYIAISVKNCEPDTLSWTHVRQRAIAKQDMKYLLGKTVHLNPSAISCAIKDTANAWLCFNDCFTGRGYMIIINLGSQGGAKVISSALNSFDHKFSIDDDLRAYTDRGNLYVVNVKTGKEAEMTFKKEFEMDFDNIHKAIDTAHITKQKLFIKLIDKDGSEVPFEKAVDL